MQLAKHLDRRFSLERLLAGIARHQALADLAAGNIPPPSKRADGRKDAPAKGRPRKRWLVLVRDALTATNVSAAELAKAKGWKRTRNPQGKELVTIGSDTVTWERFGQHVSRERALRKT